MRDSRENSAVKNELMMVIVRGSCSRALDSDGGLFQKVGAKKRSFLETPRCQDYQFQLFSPLTREL